MAQYPLLKQISTEQSTQVMNLMDALLTDLTPEETCGELLDYIGSIVADTHYNNELIMDIIGIIISRMISVFQPSPEDNSEKCFELLSLLNQVPIKSQSIWFRPALELIRDLRRSELMAEEDFETLQLMMILNEVEDYAHYSVISWEHPQSEGGIDLLDLIYSIEIARMLARQDKIMDQIKHWTVLVMQVYRTLHYDCAFWVIVCWIKSVGFMRNTDHKKQLLQNIYNGYSGKQKLITAQVLYELFDLENRLLSPVEKMGYFVKLQQHPPAVLRVQQLQQLYFFAGNYSSGIQSLFKESIQYYQLSNYYLHKSWESLRNISAYLREHLSEGRYFQVMQYVEIQMQYFSNLLSLQSNAYVENLQINYNKIEELYKQLEELSLTDSLTGLRNRRYLENNFYHMVMLAARQKVPIGFAMLDIDHFKLVNDTHGHLAGDFVLEKLAAAITSFFRKSDIIVRYGGDEFFVVLFDSSQSRTVELMTRLSKHVERHIFEHSETHLRITISIGISCHTFTDRHWDPDMITIIDEVDKALYKAKTSGRNQIIIHQNEIHT